MREIKQYKIDLEQNVYYGKSCDVSTKELDQLFNFDPNVIFHEFVCLNTKDLLVQYEKINKEQCFQKVNIEEADYIENIQTYILHDAARIYPMNYLTLFQRVILN